METKEKPKQKRVKLAIRPMHFHNAVDVFRRERNVTIDELCHTIGSTNSKYNKAIKFGKLSVGDLESISRYLKIPIEDFFPDDLKSKKNGGNMEVRNVSNQSGDNNFFNSGNLKKSTQNADSLLIEKDKQINLLKEQLNQCRADVDFFKSQLAKQ